MKKFNTDREFLQEIEAWLCFNSNPSQDQILELKHTLQNHLSIPIEPPVMQKIAEAFIRYLRSGNSYAKDNWTVNQIVKYEEDKEYCKTIYNENRLKMNFDDAHDLARTKLFEKIIKETLSGNFSA